MPPAKRNANNDDTRSDTSTLRDRQAGATGNSRTSKKQASKAQQNGGSSLKELALVSSELAAGHDVAPNPGPPGMAWQSLPVDILEKYRLAHNISTPAAFTSPWRQALLSKSGIGRQSPTMARARQKRRVSKDQLALAVRKHFNAAGVSESEVIVEFMYSVRHQDKAFKMRPHPVPAKK